MSRHVSFVVAAAVAATLFAVAGGLAPGATGRALNDCGPCPFVATLLPKNEANGPGIGLLRAVLTSHPPQRSQMDAFNEHDTLSWRLTFRNLSGAAVAAQIRVGRLGTTGPVAVTLCGPCQSNSHGRTQLGRRLATVVDQGSICYPQHPCSLAEPNQYGAYVEIKTRAHPGGEIRGQLRLCTPRPYKTYEHRGACTPPRYPLR